jgi:hypothetical protein
MSDIVPVDGCDDTRSLVSRSGSNGTVRYDNMSEEDGGIRECPIGGDSELVCLSREEVRGIELS